MSFLPGVALLNARIELVDHEGRLIAEIDGKPASKEVMSVRDKDDFKKLLGDTNSRVTVGITESMGGPYGFSSVKIHVSVSLVADQNPETVRKAEDLAFQECIAFLDDTIGKSYEMLKTHLTQYYTQSGG